MRLWLKKLASCDYYRISKKKLSEDILTSICIHDFERVTGIKLKAGEIREIESIKIKLKK
ncbi:MAG: hypothetical protein AB1393_13840 [Candidatus Edwardsbacteria bacterium]